MGEFYARSFVSEARTHERTDANTRTLTMAIKQRSLQTRTRDAADYDRSQERATQTLFVTHPLTHTVEKLKETEEKMTRVRSGKRNGTESVTQSDLRALVR